MIQRERGDNEYRAKRISPFMRMRAEQKERQIKAPDFDAWRDRVIAALEASKAKI